MKNSIKDYIYAYIYYINMLGIYLFVLLRILHFYTNDTLDLLPSINPLLNTNYRNLEMHISYLL